MARENPIWGEERIASELLVKLGIQVSPRTMRKYMPRWSDGQPRGDQRWSTFLKNHAKAIVACDFFVAVTATFRLLYVFVVIEHGSLYSAFIRVEGSSRQFAVHGMIDTWSRLSRLLSNFLLTLSGSPSFSSGLRDRCKRRIHSFGGSWVYSKSAASSHAGGCRNANQLGCPGQVLRLAGCAVCSTAENDHSMASCRLAPVLAVEVSTGSTGSTADSH